MTALTAAAVTSVEEYAFSLLLVWLVGIVLGWLLPKPKWPKWVNRSLKTKALLLATPPGLWFRRVALAAHALLIVKEVWRNLFAPGTFRGVLRNLWRTLSTGERFEWPQPVVVVEELAPPSGALAPAAADTWYISEKDLAEFKWTIEENGRPAGTSAWEPMMEKQWPGCTYTAWRRTLPSGKSEYKSVTISEDATPEEFMDFYLDDETRMKWDSMISETQLLETGPEAASRCQVVRWLRTFPFSFISQREYVIARRFFRDPMDGSLYAVTRGLVDHPAAPPTPGYVRMEGFHSNWRSRSVPCPHGSGRPAVETTLLHFEDFRINERLARFAVRHGMAGFVKGMVPAVEAFVAERRQRVQPFAEDPSSFGRRLLTSSPAPPQLPTTPLTADKAAGAAANGPCYASELSTAGSESGYSFEDSASERSRGGACPLSRPSSMRRLGAMMFASGVAIAIARTASTSSLNAAPGSGTGRHSSKRHGSASHHGKQHGGRNHGGSHHHSGSGGSQSRRLHGAPRPRRSQHDLPSATSVELEPAVLADTQS
ncbi:hypothetical protein D9Q98_010084 [Chlorella vulgaris]|uniref:START domain-containing protein n=1 Tax=Chlorella vulgaris TaxID=3077 RepID=A0A9D4YWB7_CHLVU|nr:hypothetical protein D9Q98_010084 [Chlorella vulgaris]